MEYKYGVSFNCYVGDQSNAIGGADEVCNISYVGNDKQKVIDRVIQSDPSMTLEYTENNEYVGCDSVDVGEQSANKVIGVFLDPTDPEYPVAVLLEDIQISTVEVVE